MNSESEERTFASALEADYALAGRPDVADVAGACRLGERRPLACRVHREAGAEDVEEHLSELRSLERGSGYPRAYGELSALLRARTRTSGLEEAGS